MRTKYLHQIFALLAVCLLALTLIVIHWKPVHAAPATFTVTNTNASGPGSLTQAISEANSNANPSEQDTIEFDIAATGNVEIRPSAQLTISEPVVIDGYTQSDATANSQDWPQPFDGILRVGINLSDVDPISVESNDVTLQGLVIYDDEGDDVSTTAPGNVVADGVDNLRLYGNYFDTLHNGLSNAKSITSRKSVILTDTTNVTIGGTTASQRNIFGHCALSCIEGSGSSTSGLRLRGNYIGLGSDGVTSLDNYAPGNYGGAGVVLSDGGSDVVIGGSGAAGNSFEHNYWGALSVEDFDDVSVLGNRILYNTRADGHGNQLNGAGIFFGGVTNSVIGSETAPNIIAGNYQGTIIIDNSTDAGLGNQISDNVAVQYNLIGVLDDEGTSFPNSDGVRIEGGSQDILFSHNTLKNTADPDYTSDYGIYVSESSVATILDNSIYNNELLGIDLDHTITPSHPAPTYSWIEESGGDSEVTFSLNTTIADDYRIQFFGNTELDASGAGEGETLLGSTNITHTGSGIEVFTYTLTGVVDIENLALTATTIDAGATHGYGSTSEFGGLQPQADLEIYTSPESSTVEEGTTGFRITKTYLNNGPSTITDINYNFQFSTCFSVTSVTMAGNATSVGAYNMGDDTWSGVLESGQILIMQFYGDVSCLAGNGIFFQHYYSSIYSYGKQLQELYDDNETVVANPTIIRSGDLSVSTTDGVTEVYSNADDHEIVQTITNEGSSTVTDINFTIVSSECYTITSVVESGTATNTGTYTDSPDYDWTGELAPGETLILTFIGDICGGDNTINFEHEIYSMEDSGINVVDTDDTNEDNSDNDTDILWIETDLEIATTDGTDGILTDTTDHEITQTITNNGPIAVSDIYFYDLTLNCGTLTGVTVSGTATDTGTYDEINYDWSGLLETGQNIVLTFTVDTSCGDGNNLYFNQTRNYLELNGDVVAEITAANEDYDDTTSISAPTSDFSITKTLNNPEDLAEGAELEYTITLTNNGPQDMDISMYDGQFNGFGGFNVLFYDFMPPEITYTSWSSTDDVECFGTSSNNFPAPISQPLGPGSAANLGAAFGNHSDYEIVMCNESTGVENILGNGESISGTLTATVTGSDLDFANYAFANMGQNDPTQALYAGYDGNSDLIDFIEGVDGNFNNLVKSLPVSDLRLEKELVEPFAGNEPGATVSYDMTVYNDGPMDVDLTLLDGSLGPNNIVGDFYPGADLTYVDDDNDDITCVDLGPGSIAYVGSVGEDHPDHQILMCVFTGSSGTLVAGASLTIRTSFTVNESVGTGYTNYAAVGGLSTDVDVIALNSTYGSATGDILDEIDNENFAAVSYTDPDYVDNDGDGVRNGLEDAAPNSGDANDDGTADKEQDNVTSYLNEVTGEYVTLVVDDSCSISATSMSSESGSEGDSAYNYPLGLMNFSLSCGSNGYTATVTMYYYNPDGSSYTLRKYNPNSNTYTTIPGATVTSATIDSSPVVIGSYQIEDGGALDTDGVANGVIIDPAGLGVKVTSSSDATSDSGGLSSTGASVLAALIAALSLFGISIVMHSVKKGKY